MEHRNSEKSVPYLSDKYININHKTQNTDLVVLSSVFQSVPTTIPLPPPPFTQFSVLGLFLALV